MSEIANITIEAAVSETWDAVVVGAGPAGALAAHQLAMSDARVLLVERKAFPRYKVCGACINHRAIKTLEVAGMGDFMPSLPTQPLDRLRLYHGGRETELRLNGGVAVSRSVFDCELTKRAMDAGANFLDECSATVECALSDPTAGRGQDATTTFRYVSLQQVDGSEAIVETRVVLAADGLTGSSLRSCDLPSEVSKDSRVGFGGAITAASDVNNLFAPSAVHMAIHPRGYVGLVRVEGNQLNIAGAADADFLRECGGPAECAHRIIESTGLTAFRLDAFGTDAIGLATWTGTPALTRHRTRAAADRLLLLGDTTGYVEPFTGEGIAWALTSAYQAAPLALEGITEWSSSIEARWQRLRDGHAARHQRTCRAMARLLRSPTLVRISMQAVSTFPAIAAPFFFRINAPAV